MTSTPPETRDRLQGAAIAPATGNPTTEGQKAAYMDGRNVHAVGAPKPLREFAIREYETDGPWYVRGWEDAAAEPDSPVCETCGGTGPDVVYREHAGVTCELHATN
jgi:hypothetical protein